jgi:peptidoglycan glycosyltransferase
VNRAIARMFIVGVVLFAALIANVTYLQEIEAHSLRSKPENHRQIAQELKIKRGRILGFDGSVIAGSRRRSGYYFRVYPQGSLAPQVIGYHSVALGESGIEASMNDFLTGQSNKLGTRTLIDRLLGREPTGADVKLTIVPAVQRAAQQALGNQAGAVVVLDPKTGAVIAAASAPTYSSKAVETDWARLRSDPSSPLLNRAMQGLYPPGSSFKVLTAAAALDTGTVAPSSTFDDTGTYVVSGGKVTNFGGEIFGPHTFTQALTNSINTTFGKVGDRLGEAKLTKYMQRAGFWQAPSVDLPDGFVRASGRYNGGTLLPPGAPMDPLAVAWAAVGQERVLATPLQMAMVAASVADGGTVMRPYLVQQVIAPGGSVVQQAHEQSMGSVMNATTAQTLNSMMQQVVLTGTGIEGALPGVKVAGKTGTAERGNANQAWFIAFAPADAPRVAVAVTIENTTGTGGVVAAPLAAAIMKAALAQQELP